MFYIYYYLTSSLKQLPEINTPSTLVLIWMVGEVRAWDKGMWVEKICEHSMLSTQFLSGPKIALKYKVYLKNNNNLSPYLFSR